jgi:hypothetical protein
MTPRRFGFEFIRSCFTCDAHSALPLLLIQTPNLPIKIKPSPVPNTPGPADDFGGEQEDGAVQAYQYKPQKKPKYGADAAKYAPDGTLPDGGYNWAGEDLGKVRK